ncbi:hypothetical protein Tco_0590104 [Tanacetum coccineum]
MLKELKKRIMEEQTAKDNMSIKEMRHEQQLVDRKIKEITNDLGYKRCRGEKIDEEYERDCEIRIRKLKQDSNEWGNKVRKKEKAYEEEKYSAAHRYMLSIPFFDEDDYIPLGDIIAQNSTSKAITPDLPIEEPDNSLNMEDKKRAILNYSATESKRMMCLHIDPILEEFAGELAHIAPIPPGIVEADFDPNDDTSSDDDDFEDIEYVSFEEVNDVEQEEKEFDLEDILQIQDVILRGRFDAFFEESDTSLSHLDNSLPEFETFSDHTEETRSGSTTTHANYSLPEYDSFLFEIEPDQEGLISIDNSNNTLLELPEFESFHFDPSFPRPPPEPPDVEICLYFEPDAPVINNFDVLNNDEPFDPGEGENVVFLNVEEDDSFTFTIRTFLPFVTYPEASPLSCSTGSEDTIFDPGIST